MPFVYVHLKAPSKANKIRSDEAQTQQNILPGRREFCFLYWSIKLNNLIFLQDVDNMFPPCREVSGNFPIHSRTAAAWISSGLT